MIADLIRKSVIANNFPTVYSPYVFVGTKVLKVWEYDTNIRTIGSPVTYYLANVVKPSSTFIYYYKNGVMTEYVNTSQATITLSVGDTLSFKFKSTGVWSGETVSLNIRLLDSSGDIIETLSQFCATADW